MPGLGRVRAAHPQPGSRSLHKEQTAPPPAGPSLGPDPEHSRDSLLHRPGRREALGCQTDTALLEQNISMGPASLVLLTRFWN